MVPFIKAVTGIREAQAALDRRSGAALRSRANAGLRDAAQAAVPYVEREAPILTGATRRSVRAWEGDLEVRVGPDTPYARFVIYGTRRGVEPDPWVTRGGARSRSSATAAFKNGVR